MRVEVIDRGLGHKRVNGYVNGVRVLRVDTDSRRGTVNVPATGEISAKGLADLRKLLDFAAIEAGIG